MGNIAIHLAFGWIAFELVAKVLTKAGDAGLVQGDFACRQQVDFRDLVEGALGVRVEAADAFDLVIEQVDAVGQGRAHGEQVDDAPAHRELAGGEHLLHRTVARFGQAGTQLVGLQPVALLEQEGVGVEIFGWAQALHRGGGRRHEHIHGSRGG